MSRYIDSHLDWQRRHLGSRRVIQVIAPALFLFLFIVGPAFLVGPRLDWSMGLALELRVALGVPITALGFAVYLWTILLFARVGGTQVPLAPTQALVTSGPYALSRNPMVTGVGIMVCGVAVLLGSWSVLLLGLLVPSPYLAYIKLVEERELAARFGAAYVAYKRSTPFIVPRLD